jgi:SAM-dependent methyltransferase
MPPRFISRQLSRPTGVVGRVIGFLMNRNNAQMNAFTVRRLELAPKDRVLEVGFGGGVNLPSLLANSAYVAGLDLSADVVDWAKAKYRGAVAAGRAEFRQGTAAALPFGAATFDKACTVNTIYFWPSLTAGFAEVHRVLAPSGRFVVGFLPKEWMDKMGHPADIFTSRSPNDVTEALAASGFVDVQIERPTPTTRWNAIVATRSPT